MNIDQGVRQLRITDAKTVKKAKKMIKRLQDYHSDARLPCESARDVACLYVACRAAGVRCEAEDAARWGGANTSDFLRTATTVQHLLGVKLQGVRLRDICAQLTKDGGPDVPQAAYVEAEAREILKLFKARRPMATLSDVHACAAVHIVWIRDAPKKHRASASVQKLASACSSDLPRYNGIIQLILEAVPEGNPPDAAPPADSSVPADIFQAEPQPKAAARSPKEKPGSKSPRGAEPAAEAMKKAQMQPAGAASESRPIVLDANPLSAAVAAGSQPRTSRSPKQKATSKSVRDAEPTLARKQHPGNANATSDSRPIVLEDNPLSAALPAGSQPRASRSPKQKATSKSVHDAEPTLARKQNPGNAVATSDSRPIVLEDNPLSAAVPAGSQPRASRNPKQKATSKSVRDAESTLARKQNPGNANATSDSRPIVLEDNPLSAAVPAGSQPRASRSPKQKATSKVVCDAEPTLARNQIPGNANATSEPRPIVLEGNPPGAPSAAVPAGSQPRASRSPKQKATSKSVRDAEPTLARKQNTGNATSESQPIVLEDNPPSAPPAAVPADVATAGSRPRASRSPKQKASQKSVRDVEPTLARKQNTGNATSESQPIVLEGNPPSAPSAAVPAAVSTAGSQPRTSRSPKQKATPNSVRDAEPTLVRKHPGNATSESQPIVLEDNPPSAPSVAGPAGVCTAGSQPRASRSPKQAAISNSVRDAEPTLARKQNTDNATSEPQPTALEDNPPSAPSAAVPADVFAAGIQPRSSRSPKQKSSLKSARDAEPTLARKQTPANVASESRPTILEGNPPSAASTVVPTDVFAADGQPRASRSPKQKASLKSVRNAEPALVKKQKPTVTFEPRPTIFEDTSPSISSTAVPVDGFAAESRPKASRNPKQNSSLKRPRDAEPTPAKKQKPANGAAPAPEPRLVVLEGSAPPAADSSRSADGFHSETQPTSQQHSGRSPRDVESALSSHVASQPRPVILEGKSPDAPPVAVSSLSVDGLPSASPHPQPSSLKPARDIDPTQKPASAAPLASTLLESNFADAQPAADSSHSVDGFSSVSQQASGLTTARDTEPTRKLANAAPLATTLPPTVLEGNFPDAQPIADSAADGAHTEAQPDSRNGAEFIPAATQPAEGASLASLQPGVPEGNVPDAQLVADAAPAADGARSAAQPDSLNCAECTPAAAQPADVIFRANLRPGVPEGNVPDAQLVADAAPAADGARSAAQPDSLNCAECTPAAAQPADVIFRANLRPGVPEGNVPDAQLVADAAPAADGARSAAQPDSRNCAECTPAAAQPADVIFRANLRPGVPEGNVPDAQLVAPSADGARSAAQPDTRNCAEFIPAAAQPAEGSLRPGVPAGNAPAAQPAAGSPPSADGCRAVPPPRAASPRLKRAPSTEPPAKSPRPPTSLRSENLDSAGQAPLSAPCTQGVVPPGAPLAGSEKRTRSEAEPATGKKPKLAEPPALDAAKPADAAPALGAGCAGSEKKAGARQDMPPNKAPTSVPSKLAPIPVGKQTYLGAFLVTQTQSP
ncbi:hypothetical protein DIPPA_15437 [Diplonema papillatum]|nr:hypothetical protein DIPPA_15437 [Diplonema papillatum]